jgi:arylsulfatase A-like enzyme
LHWQVGTGSNADWAVRLGDWKLIGRTRDTGNSTGKWDVIRDQLFDLGEDPEEQVNLAEQHPEVTAKLRLLHESYLTE